MTKTKKVILGFLTCLILYTGWVLWPVRSFLSSDFLFGHHLILFTNEAEARPCGGFVTAFGSFQAWPFQLQLKNVYHFEASDLGKTSFPLSKVSDQQKFWDMGHNPNLSLCSYNFENAYENITGENIDHVILVDINTIEKIFKLLGRIEFDNKILTDENLFSELSRHVSNVDRHDEETLQNRKKPLANLGKALITKTAKLPILLPKLTRLLSQQVKSGNIYIENYSPQIFPKKNQLSLIEWNLGGGKSSRYLQKKLEIKGQEIENNTWDISLTFTVHHGGGHDEPLSQDWKGVFEFRMPHSFGGEKIFIEGSIPPGDILERTFKFSGISFNPDPSKNIDHEFSLFLPRGQNVFLDLTLSMLPQKSFKNTNFHFKENVMHVFQEVTQNETNFIWEVVPDEIKPFITLHDVINTNSLNSLLSKKFKDSDFLAEIHFNEKVIISSDLNVELIDRNFLVPNYSEDPKIQDFILLEDQQTLLLGFSQNKFQQDERFYLNLKGVADIFGNPLDSGQRTLITR